MSYTVTVAIQCNFPSCLETVKYQRTNHGGLTATFAGYRAMNLDGWWVQGHTGSTNPIRAFCPFHKDRRKEATVRATSKKY